MVVEAVCGAAAEGTSVPQRLCGAGRIRLTPWLADHPKKPAKQLSCLAGKRYCK